MILEDKSIIFTRVDTITEYDTSEDDDNIGFKIVEFLNNSISKSIQNSGYFCSKFNPIYIPNCEDTDNVKLQFRLYNDFTADLIILIPHNDYIILYTSIKRELEFYFIEKSKNKEGIIK